MKHHSTYFLLILVPFLFSCNQKRTNDSPPKHATGAYILEEMKDSTLTIDNAIDPIRKLMFPFRDRDGREYLTFQNIDANEIIFYDMHDGAWLFTIPFNTEEENWAGTFKGYSIVSLDSIFLCREGESAIIRTDTSGRIAGKYSYRKDDRNRPLLPCYSFSFINTPLQFFDGKIYLTQQAPNRRLGKNPVAATIDIETDKVEILPFNNPISEKIQQADSLVGIEFAFSRCFDRANFIYSFYFDENIYVTSPDHSNVKKIACKSRYIDSLQVIDGRNLRDEEALRKMNEAPMYGNLIYDPYRDFYYRIAYPPTRMASGEKQEKTWKYGRKRFSVIIMDKNFHQIGETLFPEYEYVSTLLFVSRKGLYIGIHPQSPRSVPGKIVFNCFQVVPEMI